MIDRYKKLKDVVLDNSIPKTYIPIIYNSNYLDGNIRRYFVQEAGNDLSPIFEVNEETFQKISQKNYYKKVSLNWRIVGSLEDRWEGKTYFPSVITSNRKSIDEAAKTMPYIKYHLVNLKQFWKSV